MALSAITRSIRSIPTVVNQAAAERRNAAQVAAVSSGWTSA
jgi:hypothetical protein